MIIVVTEAGKVELREDDNFRDFKIVARQNDAPDFIARALSGVATLDPDGAHAWVLQDALRRWGGVKRPADWLASFEKMLGAVRRFGWVRDEDATVRAHIDRV